MDLTKDRLTGRRIQSVQMDPLRIFDRHSHTAERAYVKAALC